MARLIGLRNFFLFISLDKDDPFIINGDIHNGRGRLVYINETHILKGSLEWHEMK